VHVPCVDRIQNAIVDHAPVAAEGRGRGREKEERVWNVKVLCGRNGPL